MFEMNDYDDKSENELLLATQQNVRYLLGMWRTMFGPKEYNEHIILLKEHSLSYYSDLKQETIKKREDIENKIKELQREADELRRLLNINLQLPTSFKENTPLLVIRQEIDECLTDLRATLRERRQQINELLLQQEELCEILGSPMKPLLDDPLPTNEELDDFRRHLSQLEALRIERINELSSIRIYIKSILKKLDMKVQTDREHRLLHDEYINLNETTFAELRRMRESLQIKVEELYTSIDDIRKQLEKLWQRLDTSNDIREKYRKLEGYDKRTYELLMQELQRCEGLKRQNIKSFVEQLREELLEWWDKTMKCEKERNRFIHMKNNCYTDDLLVLHEMELDEVKQYYEQNKKIFALYAERQELWERMEALEAKANDPARYNNRGGQLLREEKERKTITNKLPKIEQQINELVHKYEEKENKTFTINGESILAYMGAQWELKRLEKEQHTSSRKHKTPSSTKAGISIARTPLSVKNASSVTKSFLRSTHLTPSQRTMIRTPGVSAQKRTLNDKDKHMPSAKRSLRRALESPNVQLLNVLEREKTASVTLKSKSTPDPKFKPPLRKRIQRVIATTINRRSSGRMGGNGNVKRRSVRGKNQATTHLLPNINIEECSDLNTDTDDAYESFQKDIELRSSIIAPSYKKNFTGAGKSKHFNIEYIKSTSNHPIPRIQESEH